MKRVTHKRSEKGFSLIEMMVAAVIFVLLCGAAFALLSVAQQRYQTESQVLNSFQEARFGLDEMVRNMNGSGYPSQFQYAANPNAPNPNYYAITPLAWSPNYPTASPCLIGSNCTAPSDFDMIIESDVDYWRTDGVEWTRYKLANSILSRSQTSKIYNADPITTTDPYFVPFVQNVMNDASASQIAQFQAVYPNMFPGGSPVPVFKYTCSTPFGPQLCESAGSYNSPINVIDVEITLIVLAPTQDAQTGLPRLIELRGRGHSLNTILQGQ